MSDLISRQAAIELIEFGVETLKIALDRIDITYNDREKFSWGIGLLESYIEDIKELPHAQPEVAKDTNVPNNDCINRQQAIDAVVSAMIDGADAELVEGVMELLPSAQPERKKGQNDQPESAKEYCAECDHIEMCGWYPYEGCEFRSIPQPQRERGEWIPVDSFSAFGGDEAMWMAHGNPVAFYYCSECKEQAYAGEDGESLLTDFCPSCGADMRGDSDE